MALTHTSIFAAFACFALAGCVSAPLLPTFGPNIGRNFYPPTSIRLGEEGRVLFAFHFDDQGNAFGAQVLQSEILYGANTTPETSQLNLAAQRLFQYGMIRVTDFPLADRTSVHANILYHVTVIFCLDPESRCRIRPYPGSTPLFVRGDVRQLRQRGTITP
jgi:hypothetical protein